MMSDTTMAEKIEASGLPWAGETAARFRELQMLSKLPKSHLHEVEGPSRPEHLGVVEDAPRRRKAKTED